MQYYDFYEDVTLGTFMKHYMYHVRCWTAQVHYTELTKLHIIMNDQVG